LCEVANDLGIELDQWLISREAEHAEVGEMSQAGWKGGKLIAIDKQDF